MIRMSILAALLLGSTPAPLVAQAGGRAGTSDQQKACRNDVVKLCRGLEQAGDLEIFQCLQNNRHKLSKRCRDSLEQGR